MNKNEILKRIYAGLTDELSVDLNEVKKSYCAKENYDSNSFSTFRLFDVYPEYRTCAENIIAAIIGGMNSSVNVDIQADDEFQIYNG
jgi:hypothetical protein